LGLKTHVHGAEHLPQKGAAIIASTHVSYVDFIPIGVAARRRRRWVRFLTRGDIWSKWWIAYPMDRMRHVPVHLAAPAGAFTQARHLLDDGHVLCIFIEGGISYSYAVRPLKLGVASLAKETGAPVIPTALWGIQRVFSVGRPNAEGKEPPPDWTRGRRVDICFGEPMYVGADETPADFTRRLGHRLTELAEELQTMPEHRPQPGEYAPWYPAHLGGHAPDRSEALDYDQVPGDSVEPTWGPPWPAERAARLRAEGRLGARRGQKPEPDPDRLAE
jgi:1-acyl-sn-glycerol-3-phosphate acyltransferase